MFSKDLPVGVIKSPDCLVISKPFPKQIILDSSNLNEFADKNFKFVKNGRKLSKRVENTGGKGIIAQKQFLLFTKCFQNTCTADI